MKNSGFKRLYSMAFVAMFMGLPSKADAVAYCALRDPVYAIQTFYPGFSSYRSFLGTVEPDIRDKLDAELPYQTHFNEFGKHTLYVAFDGDQAMGLVHARSEKGDWGLDELVWSFNLDLTIRDFRFQRSRSRWQSEVLAPAFKETIQGKGFTDLQALLSPDGSRLAQPHPQISPGAEKLAAEVIRSALKTIVVTEHVWGKQLDNIGQNWRGEGDG
jgi:hypothetical protein